MGVDRGSPVRFLANMICVEAVNKIDPREGAIDRREPHCMERTTCICRQGNDVAKYFGVRHLITAKTRR